MSSLSRSVPSEKGLVEVWNGHYRISGEPHILHRAERAILNARWEKDVVVVPITDETSHEIMWFAKRFPIKLADKGRSRIGSASFILTEKRSQLILDPNYKPLPVVFRKGLSPRPYQQVAADLWRTVGGLLLGDEIGLGKTIEAACGLVNPEMRPAVVVAQSNLLTQWRNSLKQFVPGMRAHIIKTGAIYTPAKQQQCPRCGDWSELSGRSSLAKCAKCGSRCSGEELPPEVLICSYGMLHSWVSELSRTMKTVVFDEVQELRNQGSKKWAAASVLAKTCRYRLGLSGTPIVNQGGEIFNVYECLCPGALGDKQTFRRTWCVGTAYQGEPPLENPAALGKYLTDKGIFLRRTRAEVGRELPPHSRIIHPIEADVSAINNISGRARELAEIILYGSTRKGEVLAANREFETLLRQATGIAKAVYVASFVDMLLQTNESVILFGFHRAVYSIWLEQLEKHEPLLYTGSESPSQKNRNAKAFAEGKSRILIVSLASTAGLDGLQFSSCRTGVFGELDWSDAKHRQGIGRYHRDGQSKACLTYFLVSEFGADPYMAEIVGSKKAQADALLNRTDTDQQLAVSTAEHIKSIARKILLAT